VSIPSDLDALWVFIVVQDAAIDDDNVARDYYQIALGFVKHLTKPSTYGRTITGTPVEVVV
jgi:hypothetical protein